MDIYDMTVLPGIISVSGVKLITTAERDNVNPQSLIMGIRSNGIDQQYTENLGVSYVNYSHIFETDGAGQAFNSTTINSVQTTLKIPA